MPRKIFIKYDFQAIRLCLSLVEQSLIYDTCADQKWSLKKIF